MMVFCNRDKVLLLIIILGLCISTHSFSHEALSTYSCNLEDNMSLKKSDLSLFEKQELGISGESAEGASVEVYRKDGALVVINTVFYGETGKLAVSYYFSATNSKKYLVELTNYNYITPIYDPDSKLASLSIHKFAVCKGERPHYPGSGDLARVYNQAVDILATIRERL